MIAEKLTKTFMAASLFCGAGGLDLGFERAGFKTVWANDMDADACETHRNWSGAEVVRGDISKLNVAEIPDIDVILGSAPCQGYPEKMDIPKKRLKPAL